MSQTNVLGMGCAFLLLLLLVPVGSATPIFSSAHPSVQCNGINVNVQPQLYYMDNAPVDVVVGVVAETGCNFAHIVLTLTITETDNQHTFDVMQIDSGTTTTVELGTLDRGIYPVAFTATGDGMSDTVDSNIFVVPPPCHYQAWFNDNWQGSATSFTFVPMDACTYTIQTAYNGETFTQVVNYTGGVEPTSYNLTMPDPSSTSVVEVTITDSNGWTDAWNQCGGQQLTYNECPAYINVNDASTAYPYAASAPEHIIEGVAATVVFLAVIVWIAGRKRGARAENEDDFEEEF